MPILPLVPPFEPEEPVPELLEPVFPAGPIAFLPVVPLVALVPVRILLDPALPILPVPDWPKFSLLVLSLFVPSALFVESFAGSEFACSSSPIARTAFHTADVLFAEAIVGEATSSSVAAVRTHATGAAAGDAAARGAAAAIGGAAEFTLAGDANLAGVDCFGRAPAGVQFGGCCFRHPLCRGLIFNNRQRERHGYGPT